MAEQSAFEKWWFENAHRNPSARDVWRAAWNACAVEAVKRIKERSEGEILVKTIGVSNPEEWHKRDGIRSAASIAESLLEEDA